jgi:protein-tyrosine-phosphatase
MPESIPRLLFVCIENSCRSQMAEAFATEHGQDRVSAFSAGSKPLGRVDPRAVRFMAEKGIDLSARRSKGLNDLPQNLTWDWIVTMGCGDACPGLPARHRLDWDLPDPKELDDTGFRTVRDQIEQRIQELLKEAVSVANATKERER